MAAQYGLPFLGPEAVAYTGAEIADGGPQPWCGWVCRRLFLPLCFSEIFPAPFGQQEFVDAHPGRGMEGVVSHAQQGVHQILVLDVAFLVQDYYVFRFVGEAVGANVEGFPGNAPVAAVGIGRNFGIVVLCE